MNDSKIVVVQDWEKLRFVYNLILLTEGLWLLREHLVAAFTQFWHLMVLFAIGANVCYCLGPLLETCVGTLWGLHADGTRHQSILSGLRYSLFGAGLAFSMWWTWMWSLRGLGKLGGSVHYVYTTEFRDQTLAFVSFLAGVLILGLILIAFIRFIRKARRKKA